jgi:DNA-binding LytR/AlgR family response regulator
MRVIIIDDEPKAIKLLSAYLEHFSKFELIATFRNGLKAIEFLNTNSVDVAFLDINMPHLSGLSLAKMLDKDIAIVFTTAYSEHALESYDVNAVDYLLKPISLERFSRSISKLMDKFSNNSNLNKSETTAPTSILLKSGLETHQVHIANITHLKKDGNYMYYFFDDKKLMVRQNIADALQQLNDHFIQIQKSYIVNYRKINSFTSEYVVINGNKIPIGLQFKKGLMGKLRE